MNVEDKDEVKNNEEEQKEEFEEKKFDTQEVTIPSENDLLNDFRVEVTTYEKYNTNKQTTFANDSIFMKGDEEQLTFAISVDGSKHSSHGFELVTKELLNRNRVDKSMLETVIDKQSAPKARLLIIHIFSLELDKTYNYQNKRDTVLYDYSTRLAPYKEHATFIAENRESKVHALEQVFRIASTNEATFMILGNNGIKGPKGSNEELSKGINYALGAAVMPVMIIKEESIRKDQKSGGFRWCFVMDRQYTNCTKVLRTFSELVNPDKDYVMGISLLPEYVNYDLNKKEFMEEMKMRGVKNFDYECEEYKNQPGKLVLDKINHQNEGFNFVVIYNNAKKHKDDPSKNENVDILKYCVCNICFVNSIY